MLLEEAYCVLDTIQKRTNPAGKTAIYQHVDDSQLTKDKHLLYIFMPCADYFDLLRFSLFDVWNMTEAGNTYPSFAKCNRVWVMCVNSGTYGDLLCI